MQIEQIYTGCLAQGAYYITSNGEGAIIDPLREVQPYLDRLKKDNVSLKYIFETHFHADFVSGHLDLSKATGAPIVYGPNATPSFEAIIAADNQIFKIGAITIKAIHTPGHTMESTCYLLIDENGVETALFSGDTLFLGDVGRPDLAQKAASMTQEELAGLLYDSLYEKILPLNDDITVYPAHGAGSACGKNMMKETLDKLGNQKKINYALNQPDKQSFIHAVLDGLTPPPAYFGMNVAMNKNGYQSFDEVKQKGLTALSLADFKALASQPDIIVLDTRTPGDFAKSHIPGSINIGIKGDFAPWAGTIIGDVNQEIVFISDPGIEEEVITRLARVGFDKVHGFLNGGFSTWQIANEEIDRVNRISAEEFEKQWHSNEIVFDVRKDGEFNSQHVKNAHHSSLALINEWVNTIPANQHFYLHCQGGYRSMIAASILKARGYHNFSEIDGGFKAIKDLNSEILELA